MFVIRDKYNGGFNEKDKFETEQEAEECFEREGGDYDYYEIVEL